MKNQYLYLQGEMFLAQLSGDGSIGSFLSVGNVPKLSLVLGEPAASHATTSTNDAYTQRVNRTRRDTTGGASLSAELENVSTSNMATALYGTTSPRAAGSTGAISLPVKYGSPVVLPNMNLLTILPVRNPSGTVTYVAGKDYRVNMAYGTIDILEGSSIADGSTITTAATYAAYDSIDAFSKIPDLVQVRFQGINMFESAPQPMIIDMYKVRFDPVQSLDILADTQISLKVTAQLLRQTLPGGEQRLLNIRKVKDV